jgi:hypothetical protein
MTLSNAERQKRHRQKLKAMVLRNEGADASLDDAWIAASTEERRSFMERFELIGPSEQAARAKIAMDMGRRERDELFNAQVEEIVAREVATRFKQEVKARADREVARLVKADTKRRMADIPSA